MGARRVRDAAKVGFVGSLACIAVAFSAPAMAHNAPEIVSVSSATPGPLRALEPGRASDRSASITDVKVFPKGEQGSREFHVEEGHLVGIAIAWKDVVGIREGDTIQYQLPKQLDIGGPLTFEIPDRALNRVIAQGVIDVNNYLRITFNKEIAGQTSSGHLTVNAPVLQSGSVGPSILDLGRFGQALVYVDPKSPEMNDLATKKSYSSDMEGDWFPSAEESDRMPAADTFSEDPFKDVTEPDEEYPEDEPEGEEEPGDFVDAPLDVLDPDAPPMAVIEPGLPLPLISDGGRPLPTAPQKKEPRVSVEASGEEKFTNSDADVSGLASLLDLLGEEDAKETRAERPHRIFEPILPGGRKLEGDRAQHPELRGRQEAPGREPHMIPAPQEGASSEAHPRHSDVSVQVDAGRDKSGKPTKEVKVVDKEPQHTAMAEPRPMAGGPWVFPGEMHIMREAQGEFMGGMLPTALAFNAIGFIAIAGGIAVLRKVK
ncbi:Ig-like domain-containing protein [Corynebacterium ulcerans]|uniref:Ig-like domain-containing protein n=1 Tax=Corynebacterium ulcerans TaxID=65058 RepID=UPI000214192F|nr:Ig-like domain-containing protein [Corynebacterium ulcerans]AEG84696.1 putative secreted protein [Corynebacterium ulcerans BR-AD22]NOL58152.1 hypothetical protein [Corynebacterium ulcerans]NOM02783.1 hypothetical protein [Corynebacterium ulcerans]